MAISSGTSKASINTFSLGRRRTEYSTSSRASLSNRGSCIELLRFHSADQMQLVTTLSSLCERALQLGGESSVELVFKRAGKSLVQQLPFWKFAQEFLHRFLVFLGL